MTLHCADCEKPIATVDDARMYFYGGGAHLCWNKSGSCRPEDWQERALAAESELKSKQERVATARKVLNT